MNEITENDIHQELELLLPWFINKTLAASERRRVESHLADCARCRDALYVLESMQSAVAMNAPAPIVPSPQVSNLLNSISQPGDSLRSRPEWFDLVVAASVVTAVVATLLLFLDNNRIANTNLRFETATSEQPVVSMEVVVNIQFEQDSGQDERQQLLRDIQAVVQSGMNGSDEVRAIVRLPAASLEELEMQTERIESLPAVRSVELLALQLPMRQQE